jgi:cellulose synthase/poly-beta-1,6-N-acetylglucosamine synthase-like glycosyltransferase
MNPFFYIIICIAIIVCAAYVLMIGMYCYAWVKIPVPLFLPVVNYTKVNVVIAARNEQQNIEKCIRALLMQTYPPEFMQITVVDDFSEDSTNTIVRMFEDKYPHIKLITLEKEYLGTGKKNAIHCAVQKSTAELIINTDADCVMGINWVASIVSYYQQTQAKMICAPVAYCERNRFFEKMQALELIALVASGASSLYYNKATLCNGANLAYTKKAFDDVGGFEGINKSPSGDDVLLMYKIKQKYSDAIHFLKHKEAIVYTKPMLTLGDFFDQRRRWASKDYRLFNKETKLSASIILGFNFVLLSFFLMSLIVHSKMFIGFSLLQFSCLLLGIKCIIDFLLLFLAAPFWGEKKWLGYFLFQEILYMFYVVIVGLIGFKKAYEWKGRKYS